LIIWPWKVVSRYVEIETKPSVDVRYHGQSYVINLPWNNVSKTSEAFHVKHEVLYGHRLNLEIELVNLRVKVQGPYPEISLTREKQANSKSADGESLAQKATLAGINKPVPVYTRELLPENKKISGPALITETISTTFIAPAWQGVVNKNGSLVLTRTAQ